MNIDIHKLYKFKKSLKNESCNIRVGALAVGGFVQIVLVENNIPVELVDQYVECIEG